MNFQARAFTTDKQRDARKLFIFAMSTMNKPIQPKHQNRFNRTSLNKPAGEVVRHSEYPCRLNFYLRPPPVEISVEDFERFALDRLQGWYN
jgi:hypothetical protein